MRIVYCLYQLHVIGGIERVTVVKANALARIPGNEVFIVVADNEEKEVPYELSPAVHFIDLKARFTTNWDHSKSFVVNYLNYRKSKRHHKLQFVKLLEELSPDIVISTGDLEVRMLISMKRRSWKVVRELHGERDFFVKNAKSFKQRTLARINRFYKEQCVLKKCDKVVVLTESELRDNWSGWNNIIAIPNPVSFKCEVSSPLTEKCIVSVGRLDRMKNFSSLIRVFNVVSKKHQDWRLEIYGDGYEMASLKSQVSQLGLQDVVFLKGFTHDIQAKLSNSSIFAFTSLSEGFGASLLESMECGVPVVSYNCPYGPRDIINDGENGYLVPLNDEQLMADRICKLIEDKELRKKMGCCAKETAKSYRVEHVTELWMQLFRELINPSCA